MKAKMEKFFISARILNFFSAAKSYYESHYKGYCAQITDRIKARLSWSDLQQFRDIIFVLATQGWKKNSR